MKKNGFTMVELLAVIVILAVLISIAVPAAMNTSTKIQGNMFCTKVETIEKAAQLWGQDRYDEVLNSNITVDGEEKTSSEMVSVKELVKTSYLKKDTENPEVEGVFITDPRDDASMMDNELLVYVKNSRIYASYQFNNDDDKELCE